MDKRTCFYLSCALVLAPATASAYIGPGAGLSLLGALWALLVAVATALVFIVAWPLRRMLRRNREVREEEQVHPSGRPEAMVRAEENRVAPVADRHGNEALPSNRP